MLNPAIHKNTASGQNEILNYSSFLFFYFLNLVWLHWLILCSKQLIIKTLQRRIEGEEKSLPWKLNKTKQAPKGKKKGFTKYTLSWY